MTILIKGMEMPDNCAECPFLDYEQGFCFASGRKGKGGWYDVCLYSGSQEFDTVRNPKCPLTEVPTPHGRLKDVDVIIKNECHSCDGSCEVIECNCLTCTNAGCDTIRALNDAPTIIEAEE